MGRRQSAYAYALALASALVALACLPGLSDAWITGLSGLPGPWSARRWADALPFGLVWGWGDAVMLPKTLITWLVSPILVAVGVALALPRDRIRRRVAAFVVTAAGFVIWMAAATCFGLSPAQGWERFVTVGCVAAVAAAAAVGLDEEAASRLLAALALPAIPVALYSIAQHLGLDALAWDPQHYEPARTISTFGNPDYLATWLAALLPICAWRTSAAHTGARRLAWAAATALVGVTVVFTYTRAAWLALVVEIPLLMLVQRHRWRRPEAMCFLLVACGLWALLSTHASPSFTVSGRVRETFQGDRSVEARWVLWGEALRVAAAHPFLGTGPDTFSYAAMPFRRIEPPWLLARVGLPGDPHNAFLELAASTGFVGLALFLACVAVAARATMDDARRGGREASAAGVLMTCGLVLLLEHLFVALSLPAIWLGGLLAAVAVSLSTPPPRAPRGGLPAGMVLLLGVAGTLLAAQQAARLACAESLATLGGLQAAQGLRVAGKEGAGLLHGSALSFDAALAWSGDGVRAAHIARREARVLEQLLTRLDPADEDPSSRRLAWEVARRALSRTTSTLEAFPLDPYAWHDLARLAMQAAALAPSPPLAAALRKQAIAAAKQGCAQDPFNAALAADLARYLARLGEHAQAEGWFRSSLELAPDQPPVILDRARSLWAWGLLETGERIAREVVRPAPGNLEAVKVPKVRDDAPARPKEPVGSPSAAGPTGP